MLEDAAGFAELRRLGARSVPVLSRGDAWIFAQNIGHVVEFIGLNEATGPVLPPARLEQRLDRFISTAIQIIPQMPVDRLDMNVPNRPRSYRVLGHHIFRVPEALLEVVTGTPLTYEMLTSPPPPALQAGADIAGYGQRVLDSLRAWWAADPDKPNPDKLGQQIVATYYGPQRLHEYLERTTWHCGQHVRQWMMLLEMASIAPRVTLGGPDFKDLPMPGSVWDG